MLETTHLLWKSCKCRNHPGFGCEFKKFLRVLVNISSSYDRCMKTSSCAFNSRFIEGVAIYKIIWLYLFDIGLIHPLTYNRTYNMSAQEENDVISALTGFSINHVLDGLSLPVGGGLSNQLGISGVPTLNSAQIYNDKWDDDAVGPDQGEDWEDEIDREMREEAESNGFVKHEAHSPNGVQAKQKRIRVVKRLVERPKSVYERFPAFEKDKTLDFSELFKGYTVHKSRLAKRPYQSKLDPPYTLTSLCSI